jgi:hypothetical protein
MRTEDNNRVAERLIDAALKQYGAAEPRPGLENRVLANLHAERERLTLRPWWWRPVAAAVTIAVFIGGALLLKRKPDVTAVTISNQPPITVGNTQPERPIESTVAPHTAIKARGRSEPHIAHPHSEPRLEQFPAPTPLSEQEEMLAQYVREHRSEATMVARARAELLKQELEQFMKPSSSVQPKDLEQ